MKPTVLITFLLGLGVVAAPSAWAVGTTAPATKPSPWTKSSFSTSSYDDEIRLVSSNLEMEKVVIELVNERSRSPKLSTGSPELAKYMSAFNQLAEVRASIICASPGTRDICRTELSKTHQKLLEDIDALTPLDPGAVTQDPKLAPKSFSLFLAKVKRTREDLSGFLAEARNAAPKPAAEPIQVVYEGNEARLDGLPAADRRPSVESAGSAAPALTLDQSLEASVGATGTAGVTSTAGSPQ